jgi:hypothetical protein
VKRRRAGAERAGARAAGGRPGRGPLESEWGHPGGEERKDWGKGRAGEGGGERGEKVGGGERGNRATAGARLEERLGGPAGVGAPARGVGGEGSGPGTGKRRGEALGGLGWKEERPKEGGDPGRGEHPRGDGRVFVCTRCRVRCAD